MKLVMYSTDGGAPSVGYIEDDEVRALGGTSMLEYIEHGRDADRRPGGEVWSLSEVRLHAPVARPAKIIAIGLNYEDHANETGGEIPEKPIVFAKYPNTIIGPGEAIRIPPITERWTTRPSSRWSSGGRRGTSPRRRPSNTSSAT